MKRREEFMLIKENALRKMIRSILLESPGMPDLNTKFKDIISSYQTGHPAIAKALEIVAQMVTGKLKFQKSKVGNINLNYVATDKDIIRNAFNQASQNLNDDEPNFLKVRNEPSLEDDDEPNFLKVRNEPSLEDDDEPNFLDNREFMNTFKAYYICYKIKSLRSSEVDELFSSSTLLESFDKQAEKIFNKCVEGAKTETGQIENRLKMLTKISDKLEYLVTENPGDFKKTIMRMLSAPIGSEYTYGKR